MLQFNTLFVSSHGSHDRYMSFINCELYGTFNSFDHPWLYFVALHHILFITASNIIHFNNIVLHTVAVLISDIHLLYISSCRYLTDCEEKWHHSNTYVSEIDSNSDINTAS